MSWPGLLVLWGATVPLHVHVHLKGTSATRRKQVQQESPAGGRPKAQTSNTRDSKGQPACQTHSYPMLKLRSFLSCCLLPGSFFFLSHQGNCDGSTNPCASARHNRRLPSEHVTPPREFGLHGRGSSSRHGCVCGDERRKKKKRQRERKRHKERADGAAVTE